MASTAANIALPLRQNTSAQDDQTSTPPHKDLWQLALNQLSDADRENVDVGRTDKLSVLNDIRALVEEKRKACMRKRWKYKKSNGEVIILRDVFEKVALWVDKFRQVGDNAVTYDPVHAALPWAGIRFVLQIVVSDVKIFGAMAEGIETVTSTITRNRIFESLYLDNDKKAKNELEDTLVKVYAAILRYLAKARRFYDRSTATRLAMSAVQIQSASVESYLKDISKEQAAVDSCARLVDAEYLRKLGEIKSDLAQNDESQEERYRNLKTLISDLENPISRFGRQIDYLHDSLQRNERIQLLHWLSTLPVRTHHQTALKDRQHGSGQWLLRKTHFVEWQKASSSAILWLHGIPGSGKTKLIASVINFLQREISPGSQRVPFAFFYCARNAAEPQRSDPNEVFRSLLKQLSCSKPDEPVWQAVVDTFKHRKEEAEEDGSDLGKLSLSESRAMMEVFLEVSSAIIVIDALDEIDPEKRHELLIALDALIQKSSNVVKIFVSSRDDNDIVCRLENVPNIYIRAADNKEDIRRFIAAEVEAAINSKRLLHGNITYELREKICTTLEEMAKGMFRWVSLQLQNLCDPSRMKHEEDVRKELGRLPKSLAESYALNYEQILQLGHQSHQLAEKSFSWLLYAQRPLKSREFIAAISVDSFGQSVEISVTDVLNICCNFVVFDDESNAFRLAHLSVREYLETREEYSRSQSNTLIVERCLDILTTSESRRHLSDETVEKNQILGGYATGYWPVHYKHAGNGVLGNMIREKMLCFLFEGNQISSSFSTWVACVEDYRYRYFRNDWRCERLKQSPSVPRNPLFVVCAFGFTVTLRELGIFGKVDINQRNRYSQTALEIAALDGNEDLLLELIKNGATINAKDDDFGMTPLHLASPLGNLTIIRILLENGAEINSKDKDGMTPLHRASLDGNLEVMRILLKSGADINTKYNYGRTSLHRASQDGNLEVMRILLAYGAEVNSKDDHGMTPLHLQAKNLQATKILLESGADVKSKNKDGMTPLHLASQNVNLQAIRILLENGSQANERDDSHKTPLLYVLFNGRTGAEVESSITLFLDHNVSLTGDWVDVGAELFHWAASHGLFHLVKDVRIRGVDVNARNRLGGTPIQTAIMARSLPMVQFLLDINADATLHGDNHQTYVIHKPYQIYKAASWDYALTALDLAVYNADFNMVKLLLRYGATKDLVLAGNPPLHTAATSGWEYIVRLLLEAKFDRDVRTSSGVHSLHMAAWYGFEEVVRLFLDHGADMEVRTHAGENPLDKAVRNSKETVVRYLLSKGAKVSSQALAFVLRSNSSTLSDELKALLAKAFALNDIDESKDQISIFTMVKELEDATDEVWSLGFSSDGSSLAAGSRDSLVYLYDTEDFELMHSIRGFDDGVYYLSWSPTQYQHLIACPTGGQASLYDIELKTRVKWLSSGDSATCCSFAPNGEFFAVGTCDSNQTLDVHYNDQVTRKFPVLNEGIHSMAISSDNAYLLCVDIGRLLHLYETAQWQEVYSLRFMADVTSLNVGRDPRYVLVSTNDSDVHLLDIRTREIVQIYTGKKQGQFMVKSIFGGLEDEYVVSGSEDGDIFIWDRLSGFLIQRIRGAHDGGCIGCAWSPRDRTMFASAGDDKKVKIWKLQQ